MVEDFDKIKEETIWFYASLYAKEKRDRPLIDNLFGHSLDLTDVEALESDFSLEEIKEAVYVTANDKSPARDGFTMMFYQVCWDFIKDDLLKVFAEFF